MFRSPKFIWATCLAVLGLTLFLVVYTSTQTLGMQVSFSISSSNKKKLSDIPSAITASTQQMPKKEKYITFLPHSGLHNQRIGLINALILAKALDRTLILPQLNIGHAIWWRPTPLAEFRLSECNSIKQRANRHCNDFTKYVPVSVESIFDLSAAHAQGIRTIQRSEMSTSYFKDVLSIQDQHILRIEDDTRFSYRIYDSKQNNDDIRTFAHRIDMEDLRETEEDVILLGSLHYTLRLALEDPQLVWLASYLKEEVSIYHPVVMRQALRVLPYLGGPDKFVGVHLRQGDGYFKTLMDETLANLKNILEQSDLKQAKLELETDGALSSDSRIPTTTEDDQKLSHLESLKDNTMELLTQCLVWNNENNHPRLRLIYMATDTPQPRTTLKALYDEFPCIFTLSDFPEIIESTLTMSPMTTGNEEIDAEMSKLSTSIGSLLFPMIDAEITSHGFTFIGTRKSTFSQYINHRYNRFQKTYHPLS